MILLNFTCKCPCTLTNFTKGINLSEKKLYLYLFYKSSLDLYSILCYNRYIFDFYLVEYLVDFYLVKYSN